MNSWLHRCLTTGLVLTCIVLAGFTATATPVTQNYGPFSVVFYNNDDTDGAATGQQDWTAQQMADVGGSIATWDNTITNTPGRQIKLHLFWNNFSGNKLVDSCSPTYGDSTTGWTYAEHIWRDGSPTAGTWQSWDTLIQLDTDAAGSTWNFGAGLPVGGQVDFRSVMTHEIGHSIGFNNSYDSSGYDDWGNSQGSASDPRAWAGYGGLLRWDKNLRDDAGNRPANGGTGTPDNFNQVDNPVWWTGTYATAVYGGDVPIYAPDPFEPQSSLKETSVPNALMSPAVELGQVVREPLPVEWAMMKDMGWTLIPEPSVWISLLSFGGIWFVWGNPLRKK
jgi:hypothetical protein